MQEKEPQRAATLQILRLSEVKVNRVTKSDMAEPAANYVFLPWVRQGAASGIQTTDMTANQAAVVSVKAQLRINNVPEVERQVRLYGPGDVIGIDPQQVVRTEPRHLSTDFEPNYFPAIEFDRPDFPWMFTPAKADTPTICAPGFA